MSLRKKVLILILTLTLLSSKETGMANYPAEEIQKVSASSYDDLLDFASKAKGIERQRLEEVMDNIASWESDYYNKENPIPNAKQVGGGPGRGAFQF